MWSTARHVAPGDLVIVWLTRDLVQSLVVTPGKAFNSRYGEYPHSDLVGIPYGSKVPSRTGRGFVHILRPTPELWTLALPHRTQILYLADIAFITSWLYIRPGAVVLEAGTGSGSFTHSIARTVGPTGHVYSYEFHEARAGKAAEEFARHGLSDIVTLAHRNVCKSGFTEADIADSVFLDLPAPWEAIGHSKAALRKDRLTRICCFSPCIEQVLRTVSALNDAGFTDITMYETLLRPHEVIQAPRLATVGTVAEKLKRQERNREDKRQRQIAASRARRDATEKRKREDQDVVDPDPDGHELELKKMKTTAQCDDEAYAPDVTMGTDEEVLEDQPSAVTVAADDTTLAMPLPESAPEIQVLSRHSKEVRGHTSFLTFACLLPAVRS
ncbi:tRNA methyltransferase complex GCD14 subunit [Russula earlei]|uniref:tRNA methyltransferase complex GCD14 subunit n=1 Tax=Russula earlei TaxID=71964 RepID=A0ACC0U3Q9_9AGAM|nr:tRNA methyltransferase complex GCD14 subunit [Russula earlei]